MNSLQEHFDARDFHKTVLSCPGPMNVLEKCVKNWLKEKDVRNVQHNSINEVTQNILAPKRGFVMERFESWGPGFKVSFEMKILRFSKTINSTLS